MNSKKIMIIAGEASGDLHGARLVQAIRRDFPDCIFSGMGGMEMAAQEVQLYFDAKKIAVVGLLEVISHLADIVRALKILKQHLRDDRPDLLIIIDFPDFNLMLAKKAKQLGIPVLYYITPQVWAWRSGRVKTISQRVDKVGVILPFEEQFFLERGVDATYVGHPLLDSVKADVDRQEFCRLEQLDPDSLLVGILPGSRKKELATLLPVFLEGAAGLQAGTEKKIIFLLPLASTVTVEEVRENGLAEYEERLDIRIIDHDRYAMMNACDAVVAASGTVALELAILAIPMVIVYQVSWLTHFLLRRFINVDFASLVNLIGNREIVPELLQEEANGENITRELQGLLFDQDKREAMLAGLEEVREKLGEPGASSRAAKLACALLNS